jgi:hypothetical protein
MKLHQISEELEHSLIAGLFRGTVPLDMVPKDALSKEGKEVYGGVDYLSRLGHKPPFSRQTVLVSASDVKGADKGALAPYIATVLKVGGGREVPDLMQALAEQQALVEITNEAAKQIEAGVYDPTAFRALFDVKKGRELESVGALLKDGKLPPIPTGVKISLPMLQEASGGVFGLWVIGGKSGAGKSALAVYLSLIVAAEMPVLYYDMENGEQVMLYRIGKIYGDDMEKVKKATERFYIRRNPRDLDADVATVPAPAMIVIDSLQKLPTKMDQRRMWLDHWLGRLEKLKQQGYTVLVVSELNGLGGFKETGEIEYTADFGFQLIKDGDIAMVNVVKNRHRPSIGEICYLERVNDWAFQETEDLGARDTTNQAKDLGL